MSKRLRTALLLVLAPALADAAPARQEPPPDLVVCLWDDDALDGPGATPALDALLAGAHRFPRAHVPCPSGRPHRAALLAGRWPRATGVLFEQGPPLALDRALPALLAGAGHASVHVGPRPTADVTELGFTHALEGSLERDPAELAAFFEEAGTRPVLVWWAPEVPRTVRGRAARRAWLDGELAALRAAHVAARPGRRARWYVLPDTPQRGRALEPAAVTEAERTRTLAVAGATAPGRVHDEPVSTLALFATLLEHAGVDPPSDLPAPGLAAVVDGGAPLPEATLHGALYPPRSSGRGGGAAAREVVALYARTPRWKYVLFLRQVGVDLDPTGETATVAHERGDELLFDLAEDPSEGRDLSDHLAHEERLRALRAATLAWWEAGGGGPLNLPFFPPPLGPPPEEPRPNIVLIVSDDHDGEHLGFLGDERVHTPTLDRLAAEGVVFPVAHVSMSRCRPSLATLLSGQLPHQTGIWDNEAARNLSRVDSLPNLLKQAGYATFVGGKYWEERPRSMGFLAPEAVDVRFRYFVRESQDELFDFVDRYADERPFFVWWAPMLPHSPFDPPGRYRALFEDVEIPVPTGLSDEEAAAFREAERTAFAMEAWFDAELGRFVERLKAKGEYEDTLFCFLIDNGWANDRPSKGTVFEAGLRTPVVLTWPAGIAGGRREPALVSTVDLYATLLDYAGVDAPADRPSRSLRPVVEGVAHGRTALHGVGYRYTERRRRRVLPARDAFALWARDERYKMVVYLQDVDDPERFHFQLGSAPFPARERGDVDLYDLLSDPHETKDLADDPSLAPVRARLLAGWRAWWSEVEGPALDLPAEAR